MDFIEIGVISEVRADRARVAIGDMVTDFLPVIQTANSYACGFMPIRVGEQVVVLPVCGSLNSGVVLRSVYQETHAAPGTNEKTQVCVFEDGVKMSYDTATSTLEISSPKKIDIVASDIDIKANVSIKGKLEVGGNIHATGSIIDEGGNTPHHSH